MTADAHGSSTRPYLVRALHDWCTDNGFTPYVAVHVGPGVQVPMEYVKNGEIVLNVSFEATSNLKLGNEFIEFKARFGGVTREIAVPLDHVVAIYARENGQGMAFPMPAATGAEAPPAEPAAPAPARGLRLAASEPPPEPALADGNSHDGEPHEAEPEPDPPSPPPAGDAPRPALKRIK